MKKFIRRVKASRDPRLSMVRHSFDNPASMQGGQLHFGLPSRQAMHRKIALLQIDCHSSMRITRRTMITGLDKMSETPMAKDLYRMSEEPCSERLSTVSQPLTEAGIW